MESEKARRFLGWELALGLIMLAVAIMGLFIDAGEEDEAASVALDVAGDAAILIGGAITALSLRNSKLLAVGSCALCLGLSNILKNTYNLVTLSLPDALISVVLFVFGLNLAYSGYRYLNGFSRNAGLMRLISTALSISYLILGIYIYHFNVINTVGFYYYINTFLLALMYWMFSFFLHSEEVRSRTFLGRIHDDLHGIRTSKSIVAQASVSRSDAEAIYEASRSGVEGRITAELSCNSDSSLLTLEKRDGMDGIRLTLSDTDSGTRREGSEILSSVAAEGGDIGKCGAIRLYCESGLMVRIKVREGNRWGFRIRSGPPSWAC